MYPHFLSVLVLMFAHPCTAVLSHAVQTSQPISDILEAKSQTALSVPESSGIEHFQQEAVMLVRIDLSQNALYRAARRNDEGGALGVVFGACAAFRRIQPYAVRADDSLIGITDQRKRQRMNVDELSVGFGRIGAHAEERSAAAKLLPRIPEFASLSGAAGRVILRVKV